MVVLKEERRSFQPLYLLKPSQQFSLFEERLKEVVNSLSPNRTTNRALKELLRRKGGKRLRKLKEKFRKFDSYPLEARKVIYNAFYRVFQRLSWAQSSGSEKEIELKVWVTSSIDYLRKVSQLLEEKYG